MCLAQVASRKCSVQVALGKSRRSPGAPCASCSAQITISHGNVLRYFPAGKLRLSSWSCGSALRVLKVATFAFAVGMCFAYYFCTKSCGFPAEPTCCAAITRAVAETTRQLQQSQSCAMTTTLFCKNTKEYKKLSASPLTPIKSLLYRIYLSWRTEPLCQISSQEPDLSYPIFHVFTHTFCANFSHPDPRHSCPGYGRRWLCASQLCASQLCADGAVQLTLCKWLWASC